MDGLRLLAAGLGSNSSPMRQWGSGLILASVVGVVALICAIIAAAWSAIALHLALQPHFSEVAAAGLTAVAFMAVIVMLLGGLKWYFGRNEPPEPQQHPAERGLDNLGSLAHLMPPPGQPLRAWDLATLVALGVINGLSKGNGPR